MSDQRYSAFQSFCRNITDLSNFKKNQYIRLMVETVTYEIGLKYYENIKLYDEYNKINWTNIKKMNDIGNPFNNTYNINNEEIQLSPTTLRYVQYALDMLYHIKQKNYSEVTIYEVGGGYGFQSVILLEIAKIFDINVTNYTIVDLPEINNIQKLYVQETSNVLNFNFNDIIFTENPKTIVNNVKENSFFISNYALGELQKQWQNYYVQKIIKKCKHGYMCWNFSVNNKKIHEYFDNIDKEIEEENPQTNCPPVKTYIVKF